MVKISLVEHEYISIIIYIFRSCNYLLMSTFCGYDSVVIPSPPLILTPQATSTSITLTWTQTTGDVVDSYTISYSFTVMGCDGHSGSFGNNNIIGIDGSTRMYTLSGLEEYTEFAITLTAVNGAGSASVSRAVHTMAGKFIRA